MFIRWLLKLFNPRKADIDAAVVVTLEEEFANALPIEPLEWRSSGLSGIRDVDPEWLLSLIVDCLGYDMTMRDLPGDYGRLASELFMAGFETEDLAWLALEPPGYRRTQEAPRILESLGLKRLSAEQCAVVRVVQSLRKIEFGELEVQEFVRELSQSGFDWSLRDHWHFIYYLDDKCSWDGSGDCAELLAKINAFFNPRYMVLVEGARAFLTDPPER